MPKKKRTTAKTESPKTDELSPEKIQEFLGQLTPNEMAALDKTLQSARRSPLGEDDESGSGSPEEG